MTADPVLDALPSPWGDIEWPPVRPEVLDRVEAFLSRLVAFPSEHERVAVVLWAAHTHALDAFESTPRLAVLSPGPGSGKTRLQEVLALLVPRAMFTVNASTAYLFRRLVDPETRPTILLDEADTIFGPRAAREHEDLRGFINTGHRRGAIYGRCETRGNTIVPKDYHAFAAVSLSGLDDLPDTVMSRAVVIRMRRRAPGERIEPFRARTHNPEGEPLRADLASWADEVDDALHLVPDMPDEITDRPADVWEPLLAVADAAGGSWPECARVAAVALVAATAGNRDSGSLGVRLLADLRDIFGDRDRMSTEEVLRALNGLEDAPWSGMRLDRSLDARGLSSRLRKYDVRPTTLRIDDRTPKGYTAASLHDAWARYLAPRASGAADPEPATPPPVPQNTATSATAATRPSLGVLSALDVCDTCGDQLTDIRAAYTTTCPRCAGHRDRPRF